jgi:hypothetical protein
MEAFLSSNRRAGLAGAVVAVLWVALIVIAPSALGDDPTRAASKGLDLAAVMRVGDPQPLGTDYAALGTPKGAPSALPTPKPTPKPTPRPYRDTVWNARRYAKAQLGATQYKCISAIFTRESQWDPRAKNPHSGAYGIPQALPGSKMATFGSNWRYSPLTQVKWGIWYVNTRYGSACQAYDFMMAHGWY